MNTEQVLLQWETNYTNDIQMKSKRINEAIANRDFKKMSRELDSFHEYGLNRFHASAKMSTDDFKRLANKEYYENVEKDLKEKGIQIGYDKDIFSLSMNDVVIAVQRRSVSHAELLESKTRDFIWQCEHMIKKVEEKIKESEEKVTFFEGILENPQFAYNKRFNPEIQSEDKHVRKTAKRDAKNMIKIVKNDRGAVEAELKIALDQLNQYQGIKTRNLEEKERYTKKVTVMQEGHDKFVRALNEVGIPTAGLIWSLNQLVNEERSHNPKVIELIEN